MRHDIIFGRRGALLAERHESSKYNEATHSTSRTCWVIVELVPLVHHYAKIYEGYSAEAINEIITIRHPNVGSTVESVRKALPRRHKMHKEWLASVGRQDVSEETKLGKRMITRYKIIKDAGYVGIHKTRRGRYRVQFRTLGGAMLTMTEDTLEGAVSLHDYFERKYIPIKYRVLIKPNAEERRAMDASHAEIMNAMQGGASHA